MLLLNKSNLSDMQKLEIETFYNIFCDLESFETDDESKLLLYIASQRYTAVLGKFNNKLSFQDCHKLRGECIAIHNALFTFVDERNSKSLWAIADNLRNTIEGIEQSLVVNDGK